MPQGLSCRHEDADRLLVELTRVYVACDDCGRSKVMGVADLIGATQRGLHTFADLCHAFRCTECPPRPRGFRNLTVRPSWARAGLPLDRGVKNDLVHRQHAV